MFLSHLTDEQNYEAYNEGTPTEYASAALFGDLYGDRNGIHQIEAFASKHTDLYRDVRECICHDLYGYHQCETGDALPGCRRKQVFAEVLQSLPGEPCGFIESSMQRQFRYLITPTGFGVVEQLYPLAFKRPLFFIHFAST